MNSSSLSRDLLIYLVKFLDVRGKIALGRTCSTFKSITQKDIDRWRIKRCFIGTMSPRIRAIEIDDLETWRLLSGSSVPFEKNFLPEYIASIYFSAPKSLRKFKPLIGGIIQRELLIAIRYFVLSIEPSLDMKERIVKFVENLRKAGHFLTVENFSMWPLWSRHVLNQLNNTGFLTGIAGILDDHLYGSDHGLSITERTNNIIYTLNENILPSISDRKTLFEVEIHLRDFYDEHPEFRNLLNKLNISPAFGTVYPYGRFYELLELMTPDFVSNSDRVMEIIYENCDDETKKSKLVKILPFGKYCLYTLKELIGKRLLDDLETIEDIWDIFLVFREKKEFFDFLRSTSPLFRHVKTYQELMEYTCSHQIPEVLDFILSLNFGINPSEKDLANICRSTNEGDLRNGFRCLDVLVKHKVPNLLETLRRLKVSPVYLYWVELNR